MIALTDEESARVAALIAGVDDDDRFAALHRFLASFTVFDSFIVYRFTPTGAPQLLATNITEARLRREMADWASGLYLLDPFFVAAQRGCSGLIRLRDIKPGDFEASEFYRYHYADVGVVDELRFLVPVCNGEIIHVFVERCAPSAAFANEICAGMARLAPVVHAFVRARLRILDRVTPIEGGLAPFALDASIRKLGNGVLTARECEVVALILRGHSARSIGNALGIEEGTVTNHKRNIYTKLSIRSQAQLFDQFLRSLSR